MSFMTGFRLPKLRFKLQQKLPYVAMAFIVGTVWCFERGDHLMPSLKC
jgi:hypothetical protein